jgi:hypothetical protein
MRTEVNTYCRERHRLLLESSEEVCTDGSAASPPTSSKPEPRLDGLLIFNRVAKTGSEMMNRLLKLLSKVNRFQTVEPPPHLYTRLWLPLKVENELAEYLMESSAYGERPSGNLTNFPRPETNGFGILEYFPIISYSWTVPILCISI